MLDRLVTMCIVSHVSDLHFTNLMNHSSVIAVIKYGRKIEYRVEHADKHLLTAHQFNQPLYIVEYRPGVVPTISFRKGISPFEGIERSLESSVGVLSAHQFSFRIEQVTIVLAPFLINIQFFCRATQLFTHTVDTPVIISIFQCACRILVNFHIIRHIAQFVIIFVSTASGSRNSRMHTVGSFQQTFVHFFRIRFSHILHESICHYRS